MINEFDDKFNKNEEKFIMNQLELHFGFEVFTPGLDRTFDLYLPFIKSFQEKKIKIITVAGTNGKGQTCHTIDYFFHQQGVATALWTSPHILSIRERFVKNGEMISYAKLNQLINDGIDEIKNKTRSMFSFYEFLFYLFLKWADESKLEYLILEVGLGGRFDAVNHFNCDLAVITSISRDHQAILGSTYAKILYEKLGITRSNKPLYTSFKLRYLVELTKNEIAGKEIEYKNFWNDLPYYDSNILLAKEVVQFFGITPFSSQNIPSFKGREEKIEWRHCEFLFIGAHNPDGMRETLKRLKTNSIKVDFILVSFSKREREDIQAMINMLNESQKNEGYSKTIIALTFFEHLKAIPRQILEDVARPVCNNNSIRIILDWKHLIDDVSRLSEKKKILVVGSYYFIGEVQRYLSCYSPTVCP